MREVAPIHTRRLDLRVLTEARVANIVAGVRDQTWAQGFPQDGDMVIARLFVDNPPTTLDAASFGARHLFLRDTGELVGTAGFFGPPSDDGIVGLGYGIVPELRGIGLATEALTALLEFAFADARVRVVRADVSHENVASQGVMQKAGLVRVSSDDALHYYEVVRR